MFTSLLVWWLAMPALPQRPQEQLAHRYAIEEGVCYEMAWTGKEWAPRTIMVWEEVCW